MFPVIKGCHTLIYRKKTDPDILLFKSGGGCLMIFGIPFMLVGIFVILLPFGIVPVKGEIPPWYFIVLFGGVFATAGAILMFGRTDLAIDRRRRIIIRRWRFFTSIKQKCYRLDSYSRIMISKENRSSKNSSTTVYPVRIVGEIGTDVIAVREFSVYLEARKEAEMIAQFLGLPLSDTGTGMNVERKADALNDSIREQVRRSGEVIDVPEMPHTMKSIIREESGTFIIIIPPSGMHLLSYAKLGIALLFVAAVIIMFGNVIMMLPMPPPLRLFLISFIGIGFVLMPILTTVRQVISETNESTRVQVSGALLRIEKQTPYKINTSEMAADEIEELILNQHPLVNMTDLFGRDTIPDEGITCHCGRSVIGNRLPLCRRKIGKKTAAIVSLLNKLAPSSGITAISDRNKLTFGGNLSGEELAYLHAIIKKILSS